MGCRAVVEMALYGYESIQPWVIVVSLTGSICMIFIPVATAQSTISLRSRKSPTPKSLSLRSENTGIATPAPRHLSADDLYSSQSITTAVSLPACDGVRYVRLNPLSHSTSRFVAVSMIINLYSKASGSFARSSDTVHSGNLASFIMTAFAVSQLPRASDAPMTASECPGATIGADTLNVNEPRATTGALRPALSLRLMTSVKAEV